MSSRITALATAASAQSSMVMVAVSGSTNKNISVSALQKGQVFYLEATAVATATIAMLPSCDIQDFVVKVPIGSSAAAAGCAVNIGIGTDATRFGTITTSGRGMYWPTNVSAAALVNASGAVVAAAPSATVASVFIVGVEYIRR